MAPPHRDGVRRSAVALGTDEHGHDTVLARGYGELAERIIEEARRQNIFVHDSPELVALLMRLDLDERIPAGLYQVVAELLLWVRELE